MTTQKEISEAKLKLDNIRLTLDNLISDLKNNKDFSDKSNYAKIAFAKNQLKNISNQLTRFFLKVNTFIDNDVDLNCNSDGYKNLLLELIELANIILNDKFINPPTIMRTIRKVTDKLMSEKTKIGCISFLKQIPIISNLTGLINNLPYYWDRADKFEKACMALGAGLVITGFVTALIGIAMPEFSPITTGMALSIVLLGYSIFTPALIGPMLNEKHGSLEEIFLSLNGLIAKANSKIQQLPKPIFNQYNNCKTQECPIIIENENRCEERQKVSL